MRVRWGWVLVLAVGCGVAPLEPDSDASVEADAGARADAGVSDAGAPDAGEIADAGGDAATIDAGPEEHVFDDAAADPGVWTWVPIEGAVCRDGSPAGIGVRIRPGATNLILFMQGGGACLDGRSCGLNRSTFDAADLAMWASGLGDEHIFDPSDPMNPVADWHAAFIAYCTGDIHGGTRTGVDVPGGPSDQSFVGFRNMTIYTALLSEYFAGVEHVLLVGSSAGGGGTLIHYEPVAAAFAPSRVTLLDDSAPFLPNDAAMAPCLQRAMRDLWGLDDALPAGCTDCFSASGDGLSNLHIYLGETYPDARFGLLSTEGDLIVRTAYGYGRNDCDPALTLPVTVTAYRNGLYALRSMLPANWGTFYADGPLHAILAFYGSLSVGGVPLRTWVNDLVAGTVGHVGTP